MPTRISMTGVLGGGKSAVCKELEKFGLKYFSTGVIQRNLAVKMGMTTLELNAYSETHPEIDELIDSELCKLSGSPDNMVIDSRMAWHFVKDTFKVFLWTDEIVAACRVMAHERGPAEKYCDAAQAKEFLNARKTSENIRFKEKYGVDCGDLRNYDLVIDTTDLAPEYIASVIMEKCKHRAANLRSPVLLISPNHLHPAAVNPHINEPLQVVYAGGKFYIHETVPNNPENHCRVGAPSVTDMPSVIPCELAAVNL